MLPLVSEVKPCGQARRKRHAELLCSVCTVVLTAPIARIGVFRGLVAPKPHMPPPKHSDERHILGMSTSPWNYSHHPKLCHLPLKLSIIVLYALHLFGAWKTPVQKFKKFSPVYACAYQFVFCFKNGQNHSRIKWPKGCIGCVTEIKQNKFLHPYAEPLRCFPQFFVQVHSVP